MLRKNSGSFKKKKKRGEKENIFIALAILGINPSAFYVLLDV